MAIYTSVHRICRPISGGRFLDYKLQDAVEALGITRKQLCVLGIVSRNDYNRNIPSLGSATNLKLVKEIVDTGKYEGQYHPCRSNRLQHHGYTLQRSFPRSWNDGGELPCSRAGGLEKHNKRVLQKCQTGVCRSCSRAGRAITSGIGSGV